METIRGGEPYFFILFHFHSISLQPPFKGKARATERLAAPALPPAASLTDEQGVELAIADGLDDVENALDDPMADGNVDDPFALSDEDMTALQSKLRVSRVLHHVWVYF